MGCWCRWAFAPIFMHFMQVETLSAQKSEMMSPLIACSLMLIHFQEGEKGSSSFWVGERLQHRFAISWQSTLTVLGGSWLQGDSCYCLLSLTSLLCSVSFGTLNGCQENKDIYLL